MTNMTRSRAVLAFLIVTVGAGCHRPGSAPAIAASPVEGETAARVSDAGALYRAAIQHSAPGEPTYDVERAIALLEELIGRFPAARERQAASDRLALLHEIRALRLELQALKNIDLQRRP